MYIVTGSKGQLGKTMRDVLSGWGVYADVEDFDITDKAAVDRAFNGPNFQAIINCAAYTNVDKAEEEPELCEKINVQGAKNLAETGVPIIHISTDYVFSGKQSAPYAETDAPNPKSVYGKTKLAGEQAVLAAAETAIVIRTSWLYSGYGNNFLKTMLNLGRRKEDLKVVSDQFGAPTYARHLAEAIVFGILPNIKPGMREIYHYSNEGWCSWYTFARKIMEYSQTLCSVLPIRSKDWPTKAKRPAYSVMDKTKIKNDFGIQIPEWQEALKQCLQNLR